MRMLQAPCGLALSRPIESAQSQLLSASPTPIAPHRKQALHLSSCRLLQAIPLHRLWWLQSRTRLERRQPQCCQNPSTRFAILQTLSYYPEFQKTQGQVMALHNQQETQEQSRERRCGTPMAWAAQERLEEIAKAQLSPEDFRVWRIQQDEPYHRLSNQSWGTPLPPELSLKKITITGTE